LKFFFDNNLSPRIARAINIVVEPLGHEVLALRDKFEVDASDEHWINALSQEGKWNVLTSDWDIARAKAIKTIFRQSKLIGFVLRPAWQDCEPLEQTWRLLKRWPEIVKQCERAASGSTYELGIKGGKIQAL
jgi:predicted nuclease of predicted toxin-antitoxin system